MYNLITNQDNNPPGASPPSLSSHNPAFRQAVDGFAAMREQQLVTGS
jgi:hypothetical protein